MSALCNAIVIAQWMIYKEQFMLAVLLGCVAEGSLYASMAIYGSVIFRRALERALCCRGGRGQEEGVFKKALLRVCGLKPQEAIEGLVEVSKGLVKAS